MDLSSIKIGELPASRFILDEGAKPPLPSIIDSTMMVAFRNCPAQFYRTHVLKRSNATSSIPLLAGATFASGLEAYRRAYYADGYSPQSCLDIAYLAANAAWGDTPPFPIGKHESRSLDRVLAAIADYFRVYPIATDLFQPHIRADNSNPTIEFGFTVPLDPAIGFPLHPSHGEPFFWAGRSDGLGTFRGLPVFSDEKTTESLGQTWSSKWPMRNQFLSYAWCYREMGLPYRTALVRGVGLLKTKITHAETHVTYPEYLLDMWEQTAVHDLSQMVEMWNADYWPERIGDACTAWGNCAFTDVCLAAPHRRTAYLRASYVHREWDPASTHNRRTELEQAFLEMGS